jgi:hypothetical protein
MSVNLKNVFLNQMSLSARLFTQVHPPAFPAGLELVFVVLGGRGRFVGHGGFADDADEGNCCFSLAPPKRGEGWGEGI